MGVLDHGKICPTDDLDNRFCPAYFGHIEHQDLYFIFSSFHDHAKILKCVCIRCSKLLVDKNQPDVQQIINNYTGKRRFTEMVDRCSKMTGCKICGVESEDGCGALQPHKYVKKSKDLARIYAEWKDKGLGSRYRKCPDSHC